MARTSRGSFDGVLAFFVLVLAIGLPAGARASSTLTQDVRFSLRDLKVWQAGGETKVSLRKTTNRAMPGEPELPVASANLELPPGSRVTSWRVTPMEEIEVPAHAQIAAAKPLVTSEGRKLDARVKISPDQWFPAVQHGRLLSGAMQGHSLATVALRPLRYLPSEGRLRLCTHFKVDVTIEGGGTPPLTRVRRTEQTELQASRALRTLGLKYTPSPIPASRRGSALKQAAGEYAGPFGHDVAYLIVTADSMVSAFQPLVDWKNRQGISAQVVGLSTVVAKYPQGVDIPEKVRMFAKDCYMYSGTVWILVAGGGTIIPPRYAHSDLLGGDNIPADSYFGNLDGNWNANSNSVFGEAGFDSASSDLVDFYPELYVGRAPCNSVADAGTFVTKTINYDRNPPANFLNNMLFFAEVLFPAAWDGNEQTIIYDGTQLAEDAYDTMPSYNHKVRLYEHNNQTFYPGSIKENRSSVIDSLNAGYNLAFHVGHGFRNSMSVGAEVMVNADIRALHNSPRNSYLVSVDCTSGAIDFDCIGAASVNNPNGGAFAFWGSTREAFPVVTRVYLQNYFNIAIRDSISEMGEALALCKIPLISLADGDYPDRWTQLTFILFGDPSLRFRTRLSSPLFASSPPTFVMGDAGYTVNVTTTGGAPVESAVVAVYKVGDDLKAGYTNASGQVTLPFAPDNTGSFLVTATKRNYTPYQGTANVLTSGAAYLYDASTTKTVLDTAAPPESGNGDGVIDAGETVDLKILVGNRGASPGTGVQGLLSTADSTITLLDPSVSYGTLLPSASSQGTGTYRLTFSRESHDGGKVPFNLHLTDNEGDTRDDFLRLTVRAPQAEQYFHTYLDSVSGATHFTILKVGVRNLGSGPFRALKGTLRPVAGSYVGLDTVSNYGNLASGANWIGSSEYRFQGQATALSRFNLFLTDAYGHTDTACVDLKAPAPVSQLSGVGAQTSITLTWQDSPDLFSIAGYYIYRSTSQGGPFARSNSRITEREAYYQDFGLAPLTLYYYYVTAVDSCGNESVASNTTSVSTNPPYHLGWPIETGIEQAGSPAMVNFDHSPDGSLEVVQGSSGIYMWHPDGAEVRDGDNQPTTSGLWVKRGDTYANSVNVSDLFKDGKYYVAACSRDSDWVFVWNEDGDVAPGWPQKVSGFPFGTIAVGDIDGDGKPEVVMGCGQNIYAWHRDGTEVRNGDSNPATNGVFAVIGGSYCYSSPALADLDGDGKLDIIIGSADSKVHAFKYTGAEVKGWPYLIGGIVTGSAAVGDIDLDGHLEVVVPCTNNNLYCLSDSGTIKPGWPVAIRLDRTSRSPSPALADLDGDGYLDVIEASTDGYIRALSRTGANLSGWSNVRYAALYAVGAGSSESSPIVADVNGDGKLEVLEGAEDANFYGFNFDGTPLAGFPIRLGGEVRGTPAVWDLTNTGKINIVLADWDKNVYVWDYPGVFNRNKMPWPMFRHDDQRSGLYTFPMIITGIGEAQLTADAGAEGISLRWSAPESPAGRITWNVYRREDAGAKSGLVAGATLDQVPSDFVQANDLPLANVNGHGAFLDEDVRGGHSYVYILETLVEGVRQSLAGPLVRDMPSQFLPSRAALFQNTPNPFHSRTAIRFQVPAARGAAASLRDVALTIHDISGRAVRTLVNERRSAGTYSEYWDGRDQSGSPMAAGVYFYRLQAGGESLTRKILLVR